MFALLQFNWRTLWKSPHPLGSTNLFPAVFMCSFGLLVYILLATCNAWVVPGFYRVLCSGSPGLFLDIAGERVAPWLAPYEVESSDLG